MRRDLRFLSLAAGLDDAAITRHARDWMDDKREAIEATLEARMLVSDGGGFRSRRLVVEVKGMRQRPVIERHDLTLLVSRRGEVRVATDALVATLDLAARDAAGR